MYDLGTRNSSEMVNKPLDFRRLHSLGYYVNLGGAARRDSGQSENKADWHPGKILEYLSQASISFAERAGRQREHRLDTTLETHRKLA